MLVVIFNQGLEFDSTFKIGWRKTAHNSIRKYVCMRVCVRVRLSMVSVKIYCLIRKKREAKTEPFFISLANFYTPPLILFNEIVLFRFFCVLYIFYATFYSCVVCNVVEAIIYRDNNSHFYF